VLELRAGLQPEELLLERELAQVLLPVLQQELRQELYHWRVAERLTVRHFPAQHYLAWAQAE
jgi:hypothetical protein